MTQLSKNKGKNNNEQTKQSHNNMDITIISIVNKVHMHRLVKPFDPYPAFTHKHTLL